MKKVVALLKEHIIFVLFLIGLTAYYVYRLYYIAPWYDEVYTYVTFINRGPLYCITRWPLPNNHVLFSALSSLFRPLGVYWGLRGISFLSAIATVILLYAFLEKVFNKGTALMGVNLYTILLLVNKMALQGRGYSFATFCLMLGLYAGYHIAVQQTVKRRYYIFWAVSLWFGLYTLVSSVYWVACLCVVFGILLLSKKEYKKLRNLVIASLVSALLTLLFYCILWGSIGSQAVKVETMNAASNVKVFLSNPFGCIREGFDYMKKNPFMQGGITSREFLENYKYFFGNVFQAFAWINHQAVLYGYGAFLVVLLLLGILHYKNHRNVFACSIASVICNVLIFLFLFVQGAYPYIRVLSFLGILIAIEFSTVLYSIASAITKNIQNKKPLRIVLTALSSIGCIVFLTLPMNNQPYNARDYWAVDAISHTPWEHDTTYFANEEYADLQITYREVLGKRKNITVSGESPDFVFTHRIPSTGSWPYYIDEAATEELLAQGYDLFYENEEFFVYKRK